MKSYLLALIMTSVMVMGCSQLSRLSSAAFSSLGSSASSVNPSANPTPIPTPGLTGTVSSITKDGITWTFSQPVVAGQFVNGDYYVVGPVTISSISPNPQNVSPYMNGSVKNPPTSNGKSGFDSRLNDGTDESWWFDSTLRSYAPLALKAGDSLISSISYATPHTTAAPMRMGDKSISPIQTMSVLTVLASAPSADAFRPSYCDRNQAIYHANNLNRNLLPSLASAKLPNAPPAISDYEAMYRRPWVDLNPFNFDVPNDYMPNYGAQVAEADSFALLLLTLDFPAAQKINLTNYMVQYGVDLYGCVQAGYGWPAFGGHRSGRKAPIIFAGMLLNNSAMKNVSATYPDKFGEDMQTMYVNQTPPIGTYTKAWQGTTVVYAGHYGIKANGTVVSPGLYGPYEHLQPNQWLFLNGTELLGESYRRCCTSLVWVGEALAMRLMNAKSSWNYNAFFDYVDRWMTEDDTQAVATILTQTGVNFSSNWDRQKQTHNYFLGEVNSPYFVDDMWAAFR